MGDGAPYGRDSVAPTLNCKDVGVLKSTKVQARSRQ